MPHARLASVSEVPFNPGISAGLRVLFVVLVDDLTSFQMIGRKSLKCL